MKTIYDSIIKLKVNLCLIKRNSSSSSQVEAGSIQKCPSDGVANLMGRDLNKRIYDRTL